MKKSNAHNDLSDVRCGCGKNIKKRIVQIKDKDKPILCYECYFG